MCVRIYIRVRARKEKNFSCYTIGRGLVRSLSLGKLHAPAPHLAQNIAP